MKVEAFMRVHTHGNFLVHYLVCQKTSYKKIAVFPGKREGDGHSPGTRPLALPGGLEPETSPFRTGPLLPIKQPDPG